MQHDHVGQTALVAIAIIRRRDHIGGDRRIRGECLHERAAPWNREGTLTLRIRTIRRERTKGHRIAQTGRENGNRASSLLFLYAEVAMRELAAIRILHSCVHQRRMASVRPSPAWQM